MVRLCSTTIGFVWQLAITLKMPVRAAGSFQPQPIILIARPPFFFGKKYNKNCVDIPSCGE
jgi:hypothetical protein